MQYYEQTPIWKKRLRALTQDSPQADWDWIIEHYNGDQDDLDHILNEIK